MMKRSGRIVLLVVGILLLGACQVPGLNTGFPDDGPPIPITEEAARSLEAKSIAAAEEARASGSSTLNVTQEELTSYVALRLEEASASAGTTIELPLSEPQIYLKGNGDLVLRGQLQFEGRGQPFRVVAHPTVESGTLVVDVVEGRVGPLPVPGVILDQAEGYIADAILRAQQYAVLEDVQIEEGELTLRGRPAS